MNSGRCSNVGLIKLLPKRTNTQTRQQEHHFGRKNTEPNNTHLPFVGVVVFPVPCQFFSGKKMKEPPLPNNKKLGMSFFWGGYLPYKKPYYPPKTGLTRNLPTKVTPTNPPRVPKSLCGEKKATSTAASGLSIRMGKGPVFQAGVEPKIGGLYPQNGW